MNPAGFTFEHHMTFVRIKDKFWTTLLVIIFPNVRISIHKAYMNTESVILRVCVCVCVCERERERERESCSVMSDSLQPHGL